MPGLGETLNGKADGDGGPRRDLRRQLEELDRAAGGGVGTGDGAGGRSKISKLKIKSMYYRQRQALIET